MNRLTQTLEFVNYTAAGQMLAPRTANRGAKDVLYLLLWLAVAKTVATPASNWSMLIRNGMTISKLQGL